MSEYTTTPAWPVILIELKSDKSVAIGGVPVPVDPGDNPRDVALGVATETARVLGRAVRVQALEPDGTVYPLIVDPDGNVTPAAASVPPRQPRRTWGGVRRKRAGGPAAPEPTRGPSLPGPEPRDTFAQFEPSPPPPTEPPSPSPPAEAETRADSTTEDTPSWQAPARVVPVLPPDREPAAFPPPVPEPAPPLTVPAPTAEQERAMGVIARALDRGEPDHALIVAKTMARVTERSGDRGAALAALELHAYIALLADRPELAARLYADAVSSWDARLVDEDAWRERLTKNALLCRLRVEQREGAQT